MVVYAYYDEFQASYTGEYPYLQWFATLLYSYQFKASQT